MGIDLKSAAASSGVDLPADAVDRLEAYLDLMLRWNRVYNLTAITARDEMRVKHLLDSLACLPYIKGDHLLDVGSGAGLPGIVLAIAAPTLTCTLLDSRAKRTRFLTQARIELALPNVSVVTSRFEALPAPYPYTTVISRAFTDVRAMLQVTADWQVAGLRHLVMKGQVPREELASLQASGVNYVLHALDVPHLGEPRHLLQVDR
ncbi:MAG: 16S rRNA (guanine(527)-N(7))-methyltransferase RsmG [Gammaproteobacteria bacterium]|nr:16S rRNA (guanine(527)-N(7))-methyltransferase RsmG [Gammaproteobacteria bacterium]